MAQTRGEGAPTKDPLAWDIAAVLKRMGGSAHQTVVIDCIAAMQRERGAPVSKPDLAARIIHIFERYRDMFVRPFGEGSQRWALAPGFA